MITLLYLFIASVLGLLAFYLLHPEILVKDKSKKSIRGLAKNLEKIRKRKPSKKEIKEFNKIHLKGKYK